MARYLRKRSRVIIVRDYSLLATGTQIDGGEIRLCPHCGKRGLENKVDGATYYTHLQEWGFDVSGKPQMSWIWCPKPT